MDIDFDPIFIPTSKRFQVSAQPPAKKTPGQIEKETDVRRSICLLFNPGPAIKAASLIIKKTVPFWRSFIQAAALTLPVRAGH
jgi:hypothetical protein